MADKEGSDLFMIFSEKEKGTPLRGESLTDLRIPGRENELIKGFLSPNMFEISRFSFGVGTDQSDDEMAKHMKKFAAANPGMKMPVDLSFRTKPGAKGEDSPVTVQPVQFTRPMDTASASLLHHTIKRTYFEKVAILKRKSAGGGAAGEAYLRLDFRGVLLTEADWSNSEPIEESYTFQSRAITMRYKPQLEDGTLGAARIGFWSMAPNAREADL